MLQVMSKFRNSTISKYFNTIIEDNIWIQLETYK
jgi:hypothetical protein